MIKNNSLGMSQKKKKDLIFYCCLLAYPIISFCIFYIAINANSIVLAFQEKKSATSNFTFLDAKHFLVNFKNVLIAFFGDEQHRYSEVSNVLTNSLKAFGTQLFIALPLGILFSYYIFKKCFLYSTFKVILFLPSIISSVVMCYIFYQMTGVCYKSIAEKLFNVKVAYGLLDDSATRFTTLLVYQLWVGFGTTILLFSGAMGGINEAVLEAGQVDGVSSFKEFIDIVFPLTFPTLIVFITIQFANLFLNQINIYPFFGQDAEPEVYTMGYYLYHETIRARDTNCMNYPFLSALGLMLTIFIAPITLGVNYLLKTYGPSVD